MALVRTTQLRSYFENFTLTDQRLYVIEGMITILWAIMCIYLVPKDYETAYFIDKDEKLNMRQRAERMAAYSSGNGRYGKEYIRAAAKNIKSWLHGCIQTAVVTVLYGFGTFLPIIIKYGFRYSTQQVIHVFTKLLKTTES